jgi:hypothetical protein
VSSILASDSVRRAIDSGQSQVIRSVEVYESDGTTLWGGASMADRLVDGSVNVTYGDNERRTGDVSLRNDDLMLRADRDALWYDKIVKVRRGIRYNKSVIKPLAMIVEHSAGEQAANQLVNWIASTGTALGAVDLRSASLQDISLADLIISFSATAASTKYMLLQDAYARGKSVLTIGVGNTGTHVPHIASTTPKTNVQWGIAQPTPSTTFSPGWTTEAVGGTATGAAPTALGGAATIVSRYQLADSSFAITASAVSNANGGKWFDLHVPATTGTNLRILLRNALAWLAGEGMSDWNPYIGEFFIDSINDTRMPGQVKLTVRDSVKRCLGSKLESDMSFAEDTSIQSLITALAANAGIKKFRLDAMSQPLGSRMDFARGTERWEVMRKAADANGYEIYFDPEGFLSTRIYRDPSMSETTVDFSVGPTGNMSNIDRVANDSRIYNHIVVFGDPTSNDARLPFIAQALNESPSSPTSIKRIGDRYYSYASTFFNTQQQTQDYANRLLALHSLESFELSVDSICYPWLEVGDIASVEDPRSSSEFPDRYLMSTLSIPLKLGPMSMTGKRILEAG